MSKQKKIKRPKRKNYKTMEEYWVALENYEKALDLTPKQKAKVEATAKAIVSSVRDHDMLSPAEELRAKARLKRKKKDIKK
jgi:hypothetical protein